MLDQWRLSRDATHESPLLETRVQGVQEARSGKHADAAECPTGGLRDSRDQTQMPRRRPVHMCQITS